MFTFMHLKCKLCWLLTKLVTLFCWNIRNLDHPVYFTMWTLNEQFQFLFESRMSLYTKFVFVLIYTCDCLEKPGYY